MSSELVSPLSHGKIAWGAPTKSNQLLLSCLSFGGTAAEDIRIDMNHMWKLCTISGSCQSFCSTKNIQLLPLIVCWAKDGKV
ncbi:hypothetical protein CEXT_172421 [Caerostris extrusa]|uniref:Uncharacterized protein n=1 Tax=Caerostris extrusa TaxID=172846 RepID=A0AAV4S058_CAEEX|nr:hypothetical protein CEXT_172421 [Caerostris extrusa]